MTDVYTQESASKKKFLAPLLVILLCMVSLTAAGYAYSATVDNTGDDIIVDGVTMQLLDKNDGEVTAAMYLVNDIHLATHTTNGHAVYYKGTNVNGATDVVKPGFNAAGNDVIAFTGDFAAVAEGYYVEVLKGTDRAEYNNVEITKDNIADYAGAAKNMGIYKIGNGDIDSYKLNVSNKSAGSVTVKATIDFDFTIADVPFLKNVYVLISGTVDGEDITPVFTAVTDAAAIALPNVPQGKDAEFVIEMYLELTDYLVDLDDYATIVPATDFQFAVNFEAATA